MENLKFNVTFQDVFLKNEYDSLLVQSTHHFVKTM